MSVYDMLAGFVHCTHCGEENEAMIYSHLFDETCGMYSTGDRLDYSSGIITSENESDLCKACKKEFNYRAVLRDGILYGFANDRELNSVPLVNETHEQFTFLVPKGKSENLDELMGEIKRVLKTYPNQTSFSLYSENEVNPTLCRKHYGTPPHRRELGETCYYDNVRHWEHWSLQNDVFTIIDRAFDQKSQLYFYKIKNKQHLFKEVSELQLIDEEKRNEKIEQFNERVKTVRELLQKEEISAWVFASHYDGVITYLKEIGELAPEFDFEKWVKEMPKINKKV